MAIEHKNIPDAQLHEAKGAAGATSGQVLVATGSGTATFQTLNNYAGWWDYGDLITASTPIPLTSAGVYYDLTNDGAGPNTSSVYSIPGIGELWNTSTSRFDFSNLSVGDMVDIRVDLSVVTGGANHQVDSILEFGVGTGSEFNLLLNRENYKTAGTYRVVRWLGFYIGSSLTKDNPARIRSSSDSTGDTVKVNGWYIKVTKRSIG